MCWSADESIGRAERQRGRAFTQRCAQGRGAEVDKSMGGARTHGFAAPETFAVGSRGRSRNLANLHKESGLLHTFTRVPSGRRVCLLWIPGVRSVEATCELYSIRWQQSLRRREATV